MLRMARISRAFSIFGWAKCKTGLAPRLPSLGIVLGPGPLKFYACRPMMDQSRADDAASKRLAKNRGGELQMSIAGFASSSVFQLLSSLSTQSPYQKFKQEFQQLGQDLQSGNLSQAQADFAALQPSSGQSATANSTQTNASPIATAFQHLSQDLQSGNLTAAQQDYSTIRQDFQQQAASTSGHHHHHHHSGESQNSSSAQNALDQLFSQLGQALQSGSLSSAQSAYSSLQQEFAQLGVSSSGSSTSTSSSSSNPLNISV